MTRAQMSAFLLKAEHGPAYIPPPCTPGTFADVACPSLFADFIDQQVMLNSRSQIDDPMIDAPMTRCPDAPMSSIRA